ncbi:helix-turn-helix domain-containing protein [Nocardiopsis lambiniae]|uniref:Helix-turn-helix domain-containing protein n=1 Tax=Nocardiopsis lambiniae TaxID=3075539 RepID=A0ABU2MFK9_9ACTN|nr:helix-turn-helix domain-containing protein [Nocardiopsis sp. DSM 44743]MDT0331489.1 helix-turn-helix domain-containing protein [Nocardiopsis sp. DSM 44743]
MRHDRAWRLHRESLPVVLGPVQAGRLLGLGRTTVYRLLREGGFPVPARRAGRSWVIPTAGVLAYLGLEPPATSTTTTGGCGCGARVNTEEKARTVDDST